MPTPGDRPTAAILYLPDGYDTADRKIMGRRAAGEAFLTALASDPTVPELVAVTHSPADDAAFAAQVKKLGGAGKSTRTIRPWDHAALARVGTVYHPGPGVTGPAWGRPDRRGYSLCGVFHTTASAAIMHEVCQYLVAPVQPWDAVVCTSHAMKDMVTRQLDRFADYLEHRIGARPTAPLQLPVIPLGVDAAALNPDTPAAAAARAKWRATLGIGADDLCALYLGRLSFHAKAHPLPMYLGLADAAKRAGKRVHLVQAGWFNNAGIEAAFRDGARDFCPGVTHHFLDGGDPAVRREVWFAADLFTTLSDNIQETFGLVPVEAMAAGLPVVASDWDGYRDTVRPGADGFLIPTWQPRPGSGAAFAEALAAGLLTYDRYLGRTNQASAVEVGACADAYFCLLTDAGLRRRMGRAGRQRAVEVFDWPRVLDRYRDLWAELAERRKTEPEVGGPVGKPTDPRAGDPFTLFASYPTHPIDEATLADVRAGAAADLDRFLASGLTAILAPVGGRDLLARKVLAALARGPLPVGELAAGADPDLALAVVGWLAKCDLVRLTPGASSGEPG